MKKALLLLFLLVFIQAKSQGINITSVTPSTIPEGINVNVKAMSTNAAGYLNDSYTITGNVIDITVCYWFSILQPVLTFDNDIVIPVSNSGNYTVNVTIYTSSSFEACDNYSTLGTYVFQHDFLNSESFSMKNSVHFYPNPTTGIINFAGLHAKLNRVDVYDISGKMIKTQTSFSGNSIDLNAFQDGVYFMKMETDDGTLNKKIILKR